MKAGVAAARGHLCCIIDADLQYQPEDILRLRRELLSSNIESGARLALASGARAGTALLLLTRAERHAERGL